MGKYSRNFNKPCPKCGQMTVSCSFDDGLPCIGDQTFEFVHECSNPGCDYHETVSHHICDGYDTDNDYNCDFCGFNWLPQLD